METPRRTTTGVFFWTPAPVRTSSPSSVDSGDVWEDEDEERTEDDDDFVSQMDENGIIGLSEALKDVELGGACGDPDAECGNRIGSFKALMVDEEVKQRKEEQCLPERDRYMDMTEEEQYGLGAGMIGSYISKGETAEPLVVSNHRCPISQSASPATAPTFSCILLSAGEETAAAPGIEAETLPEMSLIESLPESHKSHASLASSPCCPSTMLRASPQPTATFSEEVVEVKDRKRPTPSPKKTRRRSLEATYSSCSLSTDGTDSLKYNYQNTSPDREARTPRAKSTAAEVAESRKRPLSYPTPDFTKVEPRVHFPKGGYKPPKGRHSPLRESRSHEPPLMFTSPVDIVKEVLLKVRDGSPATSDSYRPPTSAPDFTVPQEFRCRQHAITLLEQLQEDYKTLLTKYADAENTIDRMRLEAKVNLYSDPPKPGHTVPSRLNQEASRFMMLDFPQAQRANVNPASLRPNTHQEGSSACPSTRSPDPQVGQQPDKILYDQADQFLQQLQTFEDLLKHKTLQPAEQVEGLLQLAEGLDSLESGYLFARDEHTFLLEESAEVSQFDPERELEGVIFQFGLHMEELKEQVDQMVKEQPTCEAPPSPPPHLTPSPVPSEETLTQSPVVVLLLDPAEAAAEEVSSASEERDEEMENGAMENSLYLKPFNGKRRHDEKDFAARTDHYQSFKRLPTLLYCSQTEGAPLPAAVRTDMHSGDEEKERQSQGTGNLDVQKGHPQRKSDHDDCPPPHTIKKRTHRSSPPSCRASNQSTALPDDPSSSRRRFKVRKYHSSSLSSLAEMTASERRNSTPQTGSSRVLSQEGIISPEMDSGFVGSESSRLTPAAAPSPLHQRAAETVSVPQEWNPGKPQTGLVSAPAPASLPSHRHTAVEGNVVSRLSPDPPRRTKQEQRRLTSPCSPQHGVSQEQSSRADCGINEFVTESDSSDTLSEDGQNDRYTESLGSLHASTLSSFLDSPRHPRALGSSPVAYSNNTIQTLQDEVSRLKERLESCLRNTKPLSSERAAQKNHAHNRTSSPRIRSEQSLRDVSRGRGEVEDNTMRQTATERPPSPRTQKPQTDILITSEPTIPQPKTLVSRCTQTSSAASDGYCSHANTVHRRTHTCQHPGVSVQVCETADEPDSRNPACLCPRCLSHHQRRSKGSAGSNKETTHSCFRHCPLCGYSESYRSTEPDNHRFTDSPPHTSCRSAESSDRGMRSRNFAAGAPPALLRSMPVGVPPLLLYSLPPYVSPSNSTGTASGVRGRKETRRRSRRSPSTDEQRFVDNSLDRAIRAARHMKLTSGHMARSLAAGLHHQERLNQSCS